ncbi:MAG: glycosyltransferase family 2 protein [Anaerolineaceae bacterium]
MKLSVVIPVYNEQETLPFLYQALMDALNPMECEWEVVLVDDGSRDESQKVLEELTEKNPSHIKVVILRRNFGQTAAIAAGIDNASGDIIVLMDADLQNDPADIPMMIEKLEQGYDLVSGWRHERKDDITRTLPSRMANWLISFVTGVHLHDYGCTLKAYRREVLTGFRLYGEMHRFIPVYADSVGAKIIEVRVNHHPRKYGKAKYGLERTLKVVLDLFTVKFLSSYANKPIYLFGGAGIVSVFTSLLLLCYIGVRKILFMESLVRSPLLLLSVMFFILGVQSVLLGLIAELLVRTYHESQQKPTYTVRKIISQSETTSPAPIYSNILD